MKFTEAEIRKVHRYSKEGVPLTEIAKFYGVNKEVIAKILYPDAFKKVKRTLK